MDLHCTRQADLSEGTTTGDQGPCKAALTFNPQNKRQLK